MRAKRIEPSKSGKRRKESEALPRRTFPKSKPSEAGLILRGGARKRAKLSSLPWKRSRADFATTRGCSSAGRAPALQAGGQEFDPPHLHQRASEDKGTATVAQKSNGLVAQVVRAYA